MTTPTPQFNGQSDPQYTNQEQAYAQQGYTQQGQPYGQPTFATSVPAGYQPFRRATSRSRKLSPVSWASSLEVLASTTFTLVAPPALSFSWF